MVHRMLVPIPYNLTEEQLKLEPDISRSMTHELEWLNENVTEDELPHILTSAVLIWHKGQGRWPIADCLATATVWARG